MDHNAHPVSMRRRRRTTVPVLLVCICGYQENWPIPLSAHQIGRATCPRCGGGLRETTISSEVAYRISG